jgi:hypothetical protein
LKLAATIQLKADERVLPLIVGSTAALVFVGGIRL